MKKIAIISFFESRNIGDILIGRQLCSLFGKYAECVCIDFSATEVYAPSGQAVCLAEEEGTSSILKKKLRKNEMLWELLVQIRMRIMLKIRYKKLKPILNECDMIILAGGNMIMDLNCFPAYTYKTYYGIKTAVKSGKKNAVLFVGAGPFKNKRQRNFAGKIAELTDYISVRDELSKKLMDTICPKKMINIWNDPVFTMDSPIKKYNQNKCIGVSIFFGTDLSRYETVRNAYRDIIQKLRKKFPEYRIKLFSSEIGDFKQVTEVYGMINDDGVTIASAATADELFNIYSELDIVLAARMHSMIIGLVCGKPVIGFSWQEKVDGLMKLMDMQDRNFKMSEMEDNIGNIVGKAEEIINNMQENVEDISTKVGQISDKIKKQVREFTEEF